MSAASALLVEIHGLVKDYQSLRPLRVRALAVAAGDVVAVSGVDAEAAEVFVHLVTGATLPDTGDVRLFGQDTRTIPDGDAWLTSLEGLGMVSARAVLIAGFTALQNIAMPFTLTVDPVDPRVLPQVAALASAVGLDPSTLALPVGKLSADAQMRTHLARALALAPRLIIAEHPSATLPRESVARFGEDFGRVARDRAIAIVALTADDVFARALGGQRLHLDGKTGVLKAPGLLQRLMGS